MQDFQMPLPMVAHSMNNELRHLQCFTPYVRACMSYEIVCVMVVSHTVRISGTICSM